MTDLLSYANSIKETKDEIRTLLNNRGISVDASEKFSAYPAKIDLLGRIPGSGSPSDEAEILTVKNNTGSTLSAGDKVFLCCAGNVEQVTKKEYSGDSVVSKNSVVVSRTGEKVLLAYSNQLYNKITDSLSPSGALSTNEYYFYNIYYMSNNIIASSFAGNGCYILFPNQFQTHNLIPIRHNWYATIDNRFVNYNAYTGECVDYGNISMGSAAGDNFYAVIGNTLFAAYPGNGWFYKWDIDVQNHTLGERQGFSNPGFLVTRSIGTTADNKYVFVTKNNGSQLVIMRYNNGEFANVASVQNMCEELVPYYNSSSVNYKFSFNEFTGNLHVITLDKFLVFHYENDTFELILQKNLDTATSLGAPTIDDNLTTCGGGRVTNKHYFYMFPSETESGYSIENPASTVLSNTTISGIVKVGGASGSNVQVIIPRFPVSTVTLSTNVDNATIEQI